MRRKINYKIKRTPKGLSLYTRGGTSYLWGRHKMSTKKLKSAKFSL